MVSCLLYFMRCSSNCAHICWRGPKSSSSFEAVSLGIRCSFDTIWKEVVYTIDVRATLSPSKLGSWISFVNS